MEKEDDNMAVLHGGYGVSLDSSTVRHLLQENNRTSLLMYILSKLPDELILKNAHSIANKMLSKIIEEAEGDLYG